MTKIDLKPHFEKFVEAQVGSGRFKNAADVIEAALKLLQDREAEHEAALASIRAKIQESMDDPRPSVPAEEVFARLEAKQARRMNGGGA